MNIIKKQSEDEIAPYLQLSVLNLLKVRTSPDVLSHLFLTCFPLMPNLTQLRLAGIFLGSNEITEELMRGLAPHQDRLELLDLKETNLTGI